MTGFKQQSGLGTKWERAYPLGESIDKLYIAKVTQVNYDKGTVDLAMPGLGATQMSANYHVHKGYMSAKLPMEYGGLNQYGKPYGTIKPILVGSTVLVGYIEGDHQSPIVLGVYGSSYVSDMLKRTDIGTGDAKDKSLDVYYSNELSLHPSLTFSSIGGNGDKVVTFTGKTFFVTDSNSKMSNPVTDDVEGLKYEDLKQTHYSDGQVIEPVNGVAPKMLFKHQGYTTADGKPSEQSLIFFIDEDGTFRISTMKEKDKWRTYFEIAPDGSTRLRRQQDTKEINRTSNYSEIGLSVDGTPKMYNSGMDLEVRKDGIYSQGKPLGSGSGSGGGEQDLSGILADIADLKNGMDGLSTEITIVQGKIESKVSFDEIEGLFDENMVKISGMINKSKEDAEKGTAIIKEITEDNLLKAEEKIQLNELMDGILAEYPNLIAIGRENEVPVDKYDTAYANLTSYVEPFLEDLELAEDIDGAHMRTLFQTYYKERTALLEAVLKALKAVAYKALELAKQASSNLTLALSDIGNSQLEIAEIRQFLNPLEASGKIYPKEKETLVRYLERIKIEMPGVINQAKTQEVSTSAYEQAEKELTDYLVANKLVDDLSHSADINTKETLDKFDKYYSEKYKVQEALYNKTLETLLQHEKDFVSVNSKITQTQEQISLVAQKVEKHDGRLTNAEARLDIQAEQISSKVSGLEVGGMIDSNSRRDQYGGENLISEKQLVAGYLNFNTGEVINGKNNPVVTPFINVSPTTKYTASIWGNTNINKIIVSTYSSSKQFIKSFEKDGTSTIMLPMELPGDARYVRMSYEYSKTVKGKLERGTVASAWRPSTADILGDLDLAQAEEKRCIAEAEQTKADAVTQKNASINSMITIAEMSQSGTIEHTEKTKLNTMWESIKAEYPDMVQKATYYGTSSSAYKIAYETLRAYVEPILKDLTTSSSINKDTFQKNFETYYAERDKLWDIYVVVADDRVAQITDTVKKVEAILDNVEPTGVQLMDNTTFRGGFYKVVGAKWEVNNKDRFRMHPVAQLIPNKPYAELYMKPIDVTELELKGKEVTFSAYIKSIAQGNVVATLQAYEKLEDIGTESTVVVNELHVDGSQGDLKSTFSRYSNVGLVPLSFTDPVTKQSKSVRYVTIKFTLSDAPEGQQVVGKLENKDPQLWVALPMVSEGTTLAGWALSSNDILNGLDSKEPVIVKQDNAPSNPVVDMIWIDTSRTEPTTLKFGELLNPAECTPDSFIDLDNHRVVPDSSKLNATTGLIPLVTPKLKVVNKEGTFNNVRLASYDTNKQWIEGSLLTSLDNTFYAENLHPDTKYIQFSATAGTLEQPLRANPSEWSAISTQEGNTVPGKTTDYVKRWTGTEWVFASPSDIESLGGITKGDGDAIIERLQEAEQKITKSAITNTVTESQHFRDILSEKADLTDLDNLATSEDLKAEREAYMKELEEKMDEINIKFTSYVTQSELTQTKEEFNFSFKKAGGVNLIRNSLGFNGNAYFYNNIGDEDKEGEVKPPLNAKEELEPTTGAVNVARNPCFVSYGDGKFYDWSPLGSDKLKEVTSINVTNHPKLYSKGLRITTSVSSGKTILLSQSRIPTIPGQEYVVHLWVRVSTATAGAEFSVSTARTSFDTGDTTKYSLPPLVNKGWTILTHRFYAYGDSANLTIGKNDSTGRDIIADITGVQMFNRGDMIGPSDTVVSPELKNDMIGVQGLPDVKRLGFSSAFRVKGLVTKYQRLSLPRDEKFTLSFWMTSYGNDGVTVSIVDDKGKEVASGLTLGGSNTNGEFKEYVATFKGSNQEKVYLKIASGNSGDAIITGLMLNVGSLKLNWTAYPSEVYNANVKIDFNGIQVINADNSGYTTITPKEFSGYTKFNNRVRRVFTLNGDVTEVKKLKVESQINMAPFILSAVNSGVKSGWALLTEE